MDTHERQLIDDLFAKLRHIDREAPPRDAEAEALIRRQVAALPAAPYYMAQAILVQEQALATAQQRVQELERQLAGRPAGGGFLAGLFGAGPTPAAPRAGSRIPPSGAPAMQPGTGGFLAGAMQTALGVAGGMLVANAITSAFAGGAEAAEPPPDERFGAEPLVEESDIGGEHDAGEEW